MADNSKKQNNSNAQSIRQFVDAVENRIFYLMVAVGMLLLLYPLGNYGIEEALLYNIFYAATLGIAVYVVSTNFIRLMITGSFAVVLIVVTFIWYQDPANPLRLLPAYILYSLFNLYVLYNLAMFIGRVKHVDRYVIYTSITIYFLIGNAFVPLYVLVDTLNQLSSGVSAFYTPLEPDLTLTWVETSYYSFTTLTTLGYGDIIPQSDWARALSNLEAMIGVLYPAILISRLVSLSTQSNASSDIDENEDEE